MKYRVCWKERNTGKVYRDEFYGDRSRAEAVKSQFEAAQPHLYWIEDAEGNYMSSQQYQVAA